MSQQDMSISTTPTTNEVQDQEEEQLTPEPVRPMPTAPQPAMGATMGLIFGVRNQMAMVTTQMGRTDEEERGGGPDFTSISGPFMAFLGEDKRRRVEQVAIISMETSPQPGKSQPYPVPIPLPQA